MQELVQITAQYSNAVLVAIMPHISNFAGDLNLPITRPVAPAHVASFRCDPRKDHIGGVVTLTNNSQFTFLDGRVCVYRSPDSYFSSQTVEAIPEFFGRVVVKEKEALAITRRVVDSLGYTDLIPELKQKPVVTLPEQIGTNHIARYRLRWIDKRFAASSSRGAGFMPAVLDVEVNASQPRIEMFSMVAPQTTRPSPKVDIVPPSLRRKPEATASANAPRLTWPTNAFTQSLLHTLLPEMSDYVSKARLDISLPLTIHDVDLSRSLCVTNDGDIHMQLYLRNGDRFNYSFGHVRAFYSHDAFYRFPELGDPEKFLGKAAMTTNQAIKLAKEIVKNLGCREKMELSFAPPTYIPQRDFTRFFVQFSAVKNGAELASLEIDLVKKSAASIYISDPALNRKSPYRLLQEQPQASPAALDKGR
jgi:hypothetical protein